MSKCANKFITVEFLKLSSRVRFGKKKNLAFELLLALTRPAWLSASVFIRFSNELHDFKFLFCRKSKNFFHFVETLQTFSIILAVEKKLDVSESIEKIFSPNKKLKKFTIGDSLSDKCRIL